MLIKPFQALYPNFDFIASPDSFCADAKNSFNEFQSAGFFEKAPKEAFYLYEIETAHRKHIGLVGLNAVEDFLCGRIKKHEKTLSEKEQHQMQLFLRWHAILKPVLLTYPPAPAFAEWLNTLAISKPLLFSTQFEKTGETHRVWAIDQPDELQKIQNFFTQHINATYIADGHHRTSTVALLYERLQEKHTELDFHDLFCAYFAADQLDILDYNRVVEGFREISPTHFIVALSQLFELEILPMPRKPLCKHELVMYVQREWYGLRWKSSVLNALGPDEVVLDASLLNELVLEKILGIEDVRTDTRITYVPGAKGLEGIRRAVDEQDGRIGFLLYPVTFDDMKRCADKGETLPPKSTYFEPRLRSGLLVKMLYKV